MAVEALKVVVRLLPPEITEEELLSTITEPHLSRLQWRLFEAGKRYKGESKATRNARCYLKFEHAEHSEQFIRDYHGHQFVDGQGEQFRAVACYAPYQKVPRLKPQKDPRDGTIFDDVTYKEFVENCGMKKAFEPPPHPFESLKPADPSQTPLLLHIKKMKEKREREKKKEKERKRWESGLKSVDEEPRRPRWRCSECHTSKNLEEDPDDRGIFYCVPCWDSWESHVEPVKTKKKKKKKYEAEEYWEADETTSKSKRPSRSDEDNWRSRDSKASGYYEESWEGETKSKKKKKKDKYEKYEETSSYWRPKGSVHAEYWETAESSKSKSKKGSRKEEEWWEEADRSHSKKKGDRESTGGGSRWRAKERVDTAGGDDEETSTKSSRRGRRKMDHDDEPPSSASASVAYWAPRKKSGY